MPMTTALTMSKIYVVTAEHHIVPGRLVKAFRDKYRASHEGAVEFTNAILGSCGRPETATYANWQSIVEELQDEHGAAYLYVEIDEVDLYENA